MDETYSVKQIADMLGTNPETVRRWIREGKLKAIQVSRKSGNIITESELKRFLKATPKYLPKSPSGFAKIYTPTNAVALTASWLTAAIIGYMSVKEDVDVRILPSELKRYIKEDIKNIENDIQQKQNEISKLQAKVDSLNYLLENEEVLEDAIKTVSLNDKNQGGTR